MAIAIEPVILATAKKLGRIPSVDGVILFGSRARGDHAARADVDLAVEAPSADEYAWDRIRETVENADTLLPIDLVRLEEASPRMRERISEEGVILFARAEGPILAGGTQARSRKAG